MADEYNGYMNIRSIVKSLIPRQLFRRIEPVGHLGEAVIANVRFGFPAKKLRFIGVTGTNGKTTTSFFIYTMLHNAGIKVGLLSTVAHGVNGEVTLRKEHMTTSDAFTLQRQLKEFAAAGVEWVVLETSSHALAQHRVWGVPYEIAVLTNLTHDHLEYHGTFERYLQAKRSLFVMANKHGMRHGVVNAEDPNAERFLESVDNSTTFGMKKGDVRASDIHLTANGSTYTAKAGKDRYAMKLQIPGEFNVSNSLAAIAVGRRLGLSVSQIEKGVAALESVEGRMKPIREGQQFNVIVDFASTPDGYEKFFSSMRPLVSGKLVALFGSAGERDASKRPKQGAIAGKYADEVILTEEDDRSENGADILNEIAAGVEAEGKVRGKDLFIIPNREEAIGFAMTRASKKTDTVVLLGKGHEPTIERPDGEYPWNESEVARTALQELKRRKK